MRQLTGIALFTLLLAACSTTATDGGTTTTGTGTTGATTTGGSTTGSTGCPGGTTTGSSTTGSCTAGGIMVTINSVDMFPPALQWLTANHLPVPSIFDAGYQLVVDGVHLDLTSGMAILTTLATLDLTPSTPAPPYTFTIDAGLVGVYDLGLLAAVGPADAGNNTTGEVQLTCAQLAQAIDAGTGSLGGAYFDYFVPAGNQPPPALTPPAGCLTGIVYGLPASYIAQLSCAAGVSTDDGGILATGIALVYFTEAPYGTGTPVAGASIANVTHGQPNGQAYYYRNDFASGSQTPPTDGTGVAALTAVVNPPPGLPPNFSVTPPMCGPPWLQISVQTNPGAVLEVVPIVP
jgi:hypothetical protein